MQVPVVEVLGPVTVRHGTGVVAGGALGGRRARVALVALALAERPVPAERLADMVWAGEPPVTWPAALRGVISALRGALSEIHLGGQRLIETAPSGYALAGDVLVDVRTARGNIRRAERLLAEGRFAAALDEVGGATTVAGAALLPSEDLAWLAAHRQALDETRLRALEVEVEAAGRLGDDYRAVTAAREAVALAPVDERAHRALIRALDVAGNRAEAISAYEHCRALLADHLGVDPSRETVEVYLAALGNPVGRGTPGRMPREQSSFVGRDAEAEELATAITRSRLTCVTGPGGVGKSRLVQHVAAQASGFEGGRYWVPLAALSDDVLVASFTALTLGARIGADDATQAVVEHLAPLGPTLLVLDGVELVADGVAELVANLLGGCPTVTILLTSRVAVAVGSGQVNLQSLPDPGAATGRSVLGSSAVQLLVDRVRDGGGVLPVDDRTAPLIARLCERCGGLPLAIELAAAQLCVMPVGDLLDQLSESEVGDDDRLRSVLRTGHAMLDGEEAAVFRRFAVLEGPVGLPLVKAVVVGADVVPARVIRLLRELAARGLLSVDDSGPRSLYRQDDDIHRFAGEELDSSGETGATFERLADAIRTILPDDPRAAPNEFEQRITDALASVRSLLAAAADGSADHDDGLEIAFRLHRYWAATNVTEGHFWLSRLLTSVAPSEPTASPWTPGATYAAGYLSYWSGDAARAVEELQAAAEMLRGRDESYRARALIFLGGLADDLDRGDDAIEFVRQAIEAASGYGVDLQVSAAMGMACVLAERADPVAARFAADAVALGRAGGSAEQLAAALPTAAMACWQVGELEAAREYLAAARPMHTGGRRIARVVLLSAATGLALADGDVAAAVDHGRSADHEATELGIEREVPLIRSLLAHALLAAGDPVGAAATAVDAIVAARSLSFDFPLAICLETAAVLAHAAGISHDSLELLLSSAAALRSRGDRPVPPTLRRAVAAVGGDVAGRGGPGPVDRARLDRAAATALDLLRPMATTVV